MNLRVIAPDGEIVWISGPPPRAYAQLKTWRILLKLRCCPWRAGQLAKATQVLQTHETGG